MQCCSLKADGHQCTVRILDGVRCKTHEKKYQITGPNATRISELNLSHKRKMNEIWNRFIATTDIQAKNAEVRAENIRHLTAMDNLLRSIQELGQQRDDDPFIARRLARLDVLRNRRREQIRERRQARMIVGLNVQAQAQAPVQRELEAFALDRQNVHTEMVVTAVKTTISKVLEIPVPIEYRTETMKTLTEVIDQCQPSLKAVWQMTAKYCNNEDIYDMGPGIYAQVLNSVWQFIKSSEHGEDLKKILASELADCVGMCAQGNLSRICNVLSGYMEGLDVRSNREILGDKLAELEQMGDVNQRIQLARAILHNMHIPETEWAPWLEALE